MSYSSSSVKHQKGCEHCQKNLDHITDMKKLAFKLAKKFLKKKEMWVSVKNLPVESVLINPADMLAVRRFEENNPALYGNANTITGEEPYPILLALQILSFDRPLKECESNFKECLKEFGRY